MPKGIERLSVADEQNKLIGLIFDKHDGFPEIEIYRNNLRASALLSITFPTVKKLIGKEMFQHVTEKYLGQCPLESGDWGMWNENFDVTLKSVKQLKQFPYVSDSATFDYALHHSERASDAVFDMSSLQILEKKSLDDIYVSFSESTILFSTHYPVIEIWHSNPTKYIKVFKDRVLSGSEKQKVVIYRPQFKSKMLEISDTEQN